MMRRRLAGGTAIVAATLVVAAAAWACTATHQGGNATVTLSHTSAFPGEQVTVTGGGLAPGVYDVLFMDAQYYDEKIPTLDSPLCFLVGEPIGVGIAPTGSFQTPVRIPGNATPGPSLICATLGRTSGPEAVDITIL